MTGEIVNDKSALVTKSPEFVYVAENGQQRSYDIVASDSQRGLAARMAPFYQIEKHETRDGVAYIGRIFHTFDDGKDIFSQRGAVLLDEHGRQISRIFDDIDGDLHLGATLNTRTHQISYDIKPDGTIEGISYRIPHKADEIPKYAERTVTEIEGVGLTPQALILEMHEAIAEDRERSKRFPLAEFINHKRGDRNEKRE